MGNKIRTFIALELSNEARDELSRITGVLKKADADVKWVRPDAVHLTLRFLGYIEQEKVRGITEKLEKISGTMPPFEILLDGIGVFPRWKGARVLWVGVKDPSGRVKILADEIEKAMAEEDRAEKQRSFKAHLTIGRIKTAKNGNKLKNIADKIVINPVVSYIPRIVLFKSDLTSAGAVHEPLAVLDFTGGK